MLPTHHPQCRGWKHTFPYRKFLSGLSVAYIPSSCFCCNNELARRVHGQNCFQFREKVNAVLQASRISSNLSLFTWVLFPPQCGGSQISWKKGLGLRIMVEMPVQSHLCSVWCFRLRKYHLSVSKERGRWELRRIAAFPLIQALVNMLPSLLRRKQHCVAKGKKCVRF